VLPVSAQPATIVPTPSSVPPLAEPVPTPRTSASAPPQAELITSPGATGPVQTAPNSAPTVVPNTAPTGPFNASMPTSAYPTDMNAPRNIRSTLFPRLFGS